MRKRQVNEGVNGRQYVAGEAEGRVRELFAYKGKDGRHKLSVGKRLAHCRRCETQRVRGQVDRCAAPTTMKALLAAARAGVARALTGGGSLRVGAR